jgi:hypothetical protein
VENIFRTGVSALYPGPPQDSLVGTLLELPGVTLKVSPGRMVSRRRKMLVQFQVVGIESGEKQWRRLHYAR